MSRRPGAPEAYPMQPHDARLRSPSLASSQVAGDHRSGNERTREATEPASSVVPQRLQPSAFGAPSPSGPLPIHVPRGLRPYISEFLRDLELTCSLQWLAEDLLETRKLFYRKSGSGINIPSINATLNVMTHAQRLNTSLLDYNPHDSTNHVIRNLTKWSAWVGGTSLAQEDIQAALKDLPTLSSLQTTITDGHIPFRDVTEEATAKEHILEELCTTIDHHVELLTRNLLSLPQDLTEASRLARVWAWTRKRVKMLESFLVISGAVIATLPQDSPAHAYAGAGMVAVGGLKMVYQHFADNPDGTVTAYEAGQKATSGLRHDGGRLLIAWLELYGIVKALLEHIKSGTPLSAELEEQIRDFFVAFHRHFQPSEDDISSVWTGEDSRAVREKFPDIDKQYQDRYVVPSALSFPDPHRQRRVAQQSAPPLAASSSQSDQRRPDQAYSSGYSHV